MRETSIIAFVLNLGTLAIFIASLLIFTLVSV